MTLFSALMRLLTLAPLALFFTGCYPGGDSPVDEEKDPHYLLGKTHLNNMDYDRAITAFENALAANPRSAAAHLRLGFLYEDKKSNYAAAIYHFEKHLELKPDSNVAEAIRQRVFSCKLELAATVPLALVSRQVQEDVRRLRATNAALEEQVLVLKTQLVEQASMFSNKLALAAQAVAAAPPSRNQPAPDLPRSVTPLGRSSYSPVYHAIATPGSFARTHVVRAGETMATISRRYNVKLSALQHANPRVEPRRLRPGQVLNLPATR